MNTRYLHYFFIIMFLATSCASDPKETKGEAIATENVVQESSSNTTQEEASSVKDEEDIVSGQGEGEAEKEAKLLAAAELEKEKALKEKEAKRQEAREKRRAERRRKRREKRREKRRKAREERRLKEKQEKERLAKASSEVKSYEFTEKGSTKKVEDARTTVKQEDLSGIDPDLLEMVQPKSTGGSPVIKFRELEHNFGRINEGEEVVHEFVFTNTGASPLVIENVEATCGCTMPFYPFVPIEPGKSDKIRVQFNSKGRLGNQNPVVTITTNANPRTYELSLKGIVDTERE